MFTNFWIFLVLDTPENLSHIRVNAFTGEVNQKKEKKLSEIIKENIKENEKKNILLEEIIPRQIKPVELKTHNTAPARPEIDDDDRSFGVPDFNIMTNPAILIFT